MWLLHIQPPSRPSTLTPRNSFLVRLLITPIITLISPMNPIHPPHGSITPIKKLMMPIVKAYPSTYPRKKHVSGMHRRRLHQLERQENPKCNDVRMQRKRTYSLTYPRESGLRRRVVGGGVPAMTGMTLAMRCSTG